MGRIIIHIHDNDFVESEHPRAPDGKFGAGSGAKTTGTPKKPAATQWTMHHGGAPSEGEHKRLTALKVPPAWTGIKLSADPEAALQVVGKDSKGRSQYLYSAAHSEAAAAAKFARLKAFNNVAGGILTQAGHDMFDARLTARKRDAAAITRLIAETGFRIGSDTDTGADVKAHGASTLTGEHVKVDGTKLSFSFIGKKGVQITKTVDHPELARFIGARLKTAGDGPIFSATDADVRDYFHAAGGAGFKVKDFRTWQGTNEALRALSGIREPTTAAELGKVKQQVAKQVAAHLGNTPTVALASYIDPAVFMRWSDLR